MQAVCAPASLTDIEITIGAISGYTGDIDLATSGLPAGFTDLSLPATVSAPGMQVLSIAVDGSAAPGLQGFSIDATDGSLARSVAVEVTVATATPAAPTLTTPADGATNLAGSLTFDWADIEQAADYIVEIDDDETSRASTSARRWPPAVRPSTRAC